MIALLALYKFKTGEPLSHRIVIALIVPIGKPVALNVMPFQSPSISYV